MYSQVFLLLTHSHVHSLQFSPKLFPMELSLVKANKMGEENQTKAARERKLMVKVKGQ